MAAFSILARCVKRKVSCMEVRKKPVFSKTAYRRPVSRARSLALCALCMAVMAVCAWVTVPFGPVPFTLQTFAVAFALLVLRPKEAVAAVAGYVLLGALGLPVFSGMRGGLGMLVGPTGGFLWGFILGAVCAVGVRCALEGLAERSKAASRAVDASAVIAFMVVTYAVGWAQLMAVSGMSPAEAFMVAIAPFAVIDVVKMVVAVMVANAVRRAVG